MTTTSEILEAAWAKVVGQPEAVANLRTAAAAPVHAYLFTGPAGSGKRMAARAFAAALLTPGGRASASADGQGAEGAVDDADAVVGTKTMNATADGDDASAARSARLALTGEHPDLVEIERVGASILKGQALDIVRMAARSPVEGRRKVLVLHEFHLLSAEAAAVLLKTVEEPVESTVFVILADQLPPELVTIASRCVRIVFRPLGAADVAAALVAEGVDRTTAERVATAANGNVERARLLAADPGLEERRLAFAEVPARIDGSGNAAVATARKLLELIDAAAAPLKLQHDSEVAALDERAKQAGERGSGRKAVEDRHRRELRRHRIDELRAGLAEIAGAYRDHLVAGSARPDGLVTAVGDIHRAIEALDRNPNEPLLLQALLLRLPSAR